MAHWLLFPAIFLISMVLTMAGLGGGLIYSPLFVLLGLPLSSAIAASLFLNGVAAIGAAINYLRKKMVDFESGIPLLITSTIFAPVGAYLLPLIPLNFFICLLIGVVFLAAVQMLFFKPPKKIQKRAATKNKIFLGGICGLIIGLIAGLLGIGGGVFIVPLLIYLAGVPTKRAAATSIFVVVFSSFGGFLGHASLSSPDWRFILLAAIFSFAGGQVGSRLMVQKLRSRSVRILFGLVLLLFCLKLIQKI